MSKYISPAFLEAKTGIKQNPAPKPKQATQSKLTKAQKATATDGGNSTLHKAKKAKNDEFYTCLADIENELRHYKDHFKDKIVYCNCDDPYESNFLQYFLLNFKHLGLKKLISTGYATSPIVGTQLSLFENDLPIYRKAHKIEITSVDDLNLTDNQIIKLHDLPKKAKGIKITNLNDSKAKDGTVYLGGDFRSRECIKLLCEADIVVTNPPFSLFREYIAQLVEYNKKFLVIGNQNAITYKEIFPLIKENKIWLGNYLVKIFVVPNLIEIKDNIKKGDDGKYYANFGNVCWFTNLTHSKRQEKIISYKIYNPSDYPKYDNYNAIEVSKTANIPMDYDGVMGVPITFLDKYNPEQFEILGATESEGIGFSNGLWIEGSSAKQALVNGEKVYKRLFIKHKGVK